MTNQIYITYDMQGFQHRDQHKQKQHTRLLIIEESITLESYSALSISDKLKTLEYLLNQFDNWVTKIISRLKNGYITMDEKEELIVTYNEKQKRYKKYLTILENNYSIFADMAIRRLYKKRSDSLDYTIEILDSLFQSAIDVGLVICIKLTNRLE